MVFEVRDCDGLFWGEFQALGEAIRHASGVGHGASVVRKDGHRDVLVAVVEGDEERKTRERMVA